MSVIGSNIIAGASGTVETGYQIARSLRFNSADSAYLNRTPGTAGNRKTFTYSTWFKRASLASGTYTILGLGVGGSFEEGLAIASDVINFYSYSSGAFQARLITTQVFRDAGAWMHVLVAVDTTQATSTNRIKLYINGQQVTAFSTGTYPNQNYDFFINSTNAHNIGRYYTGVDYFNGYLADSILIDGQALDPTSFGQTDSATGVWVPKAYTGTYGTNGFWLKLDDNSNTTAATLGKDSSGNSNNWTPNNFSVTAGVGNDSLVDSPTNYGTDTGAGGEVRGNYATLNNLLNTTGSYANGNLERTTSDNTGALGTICPSSGKWYAEFVWTAIGSTAVGAIVSTRIAASGADGLGQTWQLSSDNRGFLYNAGSSTSVTGWTTNDVIGLAFDCSTGAASFYKNGTLLGTITNAAFANVPVGIGACAGSTPGTNTFIVNFGQRPFAYTAPSGFKALCTQNLPTPIIGTSNTNLANDYFNVVTYTGTGSSLSVTGVGFQPDLVWIKGRSGATDHALYDAVRGVQKQLESNTTTDETTESTGLTAFGTDGFTVGALAQLNTSAATYVGWNWKESTTSGFDIVTYTGNGANRTISHGLGVAPKMVIVKARTTAGTDTGWPVWHTGIANTNYIDLNGSAASTSGTTYWNSTSPTSSVFSVGTAAAVNTNNDTYVAYLFAEVEGFSKFGSYTGNGSTDGVFLYCGFSPRYVMVKQTDAVGNWIIWDTARSTFNQSQKYVVTNGTAAAEGDLAAVAIDILSNGFKCRTTDNDINGTTNTYIFAAFAEFPFQYARAR